MGLEVLGDLLKLSSEYMRLIEAIQKTYTPVRLQVLDQATPFVLSTVWRSLGLPTLVIVPSTEDAEIPIK